MLEKLELENCDILINMAYMPPKNNQLWGADYMLMDSNAFLGSVDDEKYDRIIDMFMKIWNVKEYALLNNM